MNLLKSFIRGTDPIDEQPEEVEVDEYGRPYDDEDYNDPDIAKGIAAVDSSSRKTPTFKPAVTSEKVTVKIMRPRSTADSVDIADQLKEGSIVILDISNLENKDQAFRLIDFLAGIAYIIGGEMTKTSRNTIVISPAGVDIASVIPDFIGEESED